MGSVKRDPRAKAQQILERFVRARALVLRAVMLVLRSQANELDGRNAWRAAHGLAAKHSDQCSVSGSAAEPPVASKVAEVVRWGR